MLNIDCKFSYELGKCQFDSAEKNSNANIKIYTAVSKLPKSSQGYETPAANNFQTAQEEKTNPFEG